MKTQNLVVSIFSLFFVSTVFADNSFIGKGLDRGVIITVAPENPSSKSGDQSLIKGRIKLVGKKDHDDKGPKKGLLEELQKKGLQISASFPSSVVDVSNDLTLRDIDNDEIEFSYRTPAIVAGDLNQFSIKVFDDGAKKSSLARLAAINSKIQRAIHKIEQLQTFYQNKKNSDKVIAVFAKEIENLQIISQKIEAKINSSESLLVV